MQQLVSKQENDIIPQIEGLSNCHGGDDWTEFESSPKCKTNERIRLK